jgi:hypothetical protein
VGGWHAVRWLASAGVWMGVIYGNGRLGGWHQLGYGWMGLYIAMVC